MNKIYFFLLLFLSSSSEASSYYIDQHAKKETNCQSKEQACPLKRFLELRSNAKIKLITGDQVAFKRSQHFPLSLKFKNIHGTQQSPISFIAYGEGEDPLLSANREISNLKWYKEKENQWSTPLKVKTSRLWHQGVEQAFANHDPLSPNAIWRWRDQKLYLYATSKPKGQFCLNAYYYALYFNACSYIQIKDLKIEGGSNAAIGLENSQNFHIQNCSIGKNSGYGIFIKNSDNLIITRNIFDANFTLRYKTPIVPNDINHGVHDGIYLRGTVTNSHISYNDFINWGHAGITATTKDKKGEEIAYNKIVHNYFTAKDISYGRAIAYSGNTHHNEISNNYIEKIPTQNQLNGHSNYFHHNVIDQVTDTPLKEGQQGHAITIEDYALSSYNNRIVHNTISNIEGAGIAFIALGEKTKERIFANTIAHNYFWNCGNPKSKFRSIYIPHYSDVKAQYFYDNAILSDFNKTIYYRKEFLSVEAFNKKNNLNKNNDQIHANQSIFNPDEHGAGEIKQIRYNTGSNAPL